MWRSLGGVLARSGLLLAWGWSGTIPLDSYVRAPLAVAVSVVMASLLFGELSFLPVLAGALSPLLPALSGGSSAWALFATSLVWLAPPWVLARSRAHLSWLVGLSVVIAVVLAKVSAQALLAEIPWCLAASLFGAVALGLPRALVPLESPAAHALRAAGRVIGAPWQEELERAAEIRDGGTASGGPWGALVFAAEERAASMKRAGSPSEEAGEKLDARLRGALTTLVPERPGGSGS